MKKNDDGYVLPFVLVVLIVMALVATTALSAALRNINTQQNFIKRMQDRYQAEGEIERVVAELIDAEYDLVTQNAIYEVLSEACDNRGTNDYQTSSGQNEAAAIPEGATLNYPFSLESRYNTVVIKADIVFTGTVQEDGGKYKINTPQITYTSYEIGGAG